MSTDERVLRAHQVSDDQTVSVLEVGVAFAALTEEEKKYAHFLSLASWNGALICLEQTSPESPQLFGLFTRLFSYQSVESLKASALNQGIAAVDVERFLRFAATFFGNMGNYLSFGDTKLIPAVSKESFRAIVGCTSAQGSLRADLLRRCDAVLDAVYDLSPRVRELGYPDKAVSTYYSPSVTREQIDIVNEFMAERGISAYNTRLLATSTALELRIACAQPQVVREHVQYKGVDINIVYGDYEQRLADVAHYLTQALPFAANDNQKQMLEHYIQHFKQGDIAHHMNAQRAWIKDIGPAVESNIGFIESYRDPAGVRGEFEGFVAVVNKETSRKFATLVDAAPTFLTRLPWPKAFESDRFLRPDFTSLEVISFASSGVPAGINIPNYDVIRQNEGFKNVSLGNVITASGASAAAFSFLRDEDQTLFATLKVASFEVQVGCHELLGHGSGKLLVEKADGSLNFDPTLINPVTGAQVATWYKPGQTYDSVFGSMSSALEECRAECVGVYLSADRQVLSVFGHEGQEASDIMYVNWLNMARAGLLGLEFYSVDTKNWRQAHMQARFAILRTMLDASAAHEQQTGRAFLKIVQSENNARIELDRELIESVGVPAVAALLQKIQIYRSTADIVAARQMFLEERTAVDAYFVGLRSLVMSLKKPRPVFVQANTSIQDGAVVLKQYPGNSEGMIQSFVERFSPFGSATLPPVQFAQ